MSNNQQSDATALLAERRTDRSPSTTPHRSPPERLALTASTDNFLGGFGLTDHLEKRVQGLDAEPANSYNHQTPATFATKRRD